MALEGDWEVLDVGVQAETLSDCSVRSSSDEDAQPPSLVRHLFDTHRGVSRRPMGMREPNTALLSRDARSYGRYKIDRRRGRAAALSAAAAGAAVAAVAAAVAADADDDDSCGTVRSLSPVPSEGGQGLACTAAEELTAVAQALDAATRLCSDCLQYLRTADPTCPVTGLPHSADDGDPSMSVSLSPSPPRRRGVGPLRRVYQALEP
eukprot:TRINITY_DN14006_c0_g1_i1.p1 TRINITY_DN14006_c0_g1~~TRINITY_DN14006_c0_g1_i1.p1  ORF type:complete len:222 (+),score=92.44 TRINITY_DN14006_c0_g1_i1:46-666(+)